MRDKELRILRDEELYQTYLRGLREEDFLNMHEAADWCRSQKASQFFVSSKSLVNYIGAIKKGRTPSKMFNENKEKMEMLYSMFLEFKRTHPTTDLSRERICEMLVEETAPRFFICHDSAMKAILRERKKRFK